MHGDEHNAARLGRGMSELGLELSPRARERLLAYAAELARWNRAYRLTGDSTPDTLITKHLLDSLSIASYLHGSRVADVGSGAGLPGVPLAVVCPERSFTLVETNAKRVRFLRHVVLELGLENTEVARSRAEDYRPQAGFDTVMSRAVASLPALVDMAGHLCAAGGKILAMKGRRPEQELSAVPVEWRVAAIHRLAVPLLDAERHLVVIERDE